MATKKELRKRYLECRKKADVSVLSAQILSHFELWIQDKSFSTVASYMPVHELHEIDLVPFEESLRRHTPEVIIAYPTIEYGEMNFYHESHEAEWKKNKWNITELHNGVHVRPENIDIVICPLLVCDLSGFRLGYGKGFYDRFLKEVSSKCVTAGLGYFPPISSIPEVFSGDVAMDFYIYPEGIIEFK